jgi:hypothetical protein
VSAEISRFPNASTQFRGGERLGKPRPLIGKRRARRLKVAAAVAEAVHGPQQVFAGDSVDYLRAVMRGEIKPDPVQMAAAMALARFEHPTLAASLTASVEQGRANQSRASELASALRRMQKLSAVGE